MAFGLDEDLRVCTESTMISIGDWIEELPPDML